MTTSYRIFLGAIGSLIGTVAALFFELTVAGGIELSPISHLVFPLATGAVIGGVIGFRYCKFAEKLLELICHLF